MSVALALTAFGLAASLGRLFMAASIFSFTSMKARSVSVPKSNDRRMMPEPSRVSLRISLSPDTCMSCLLSGATIVFSSSRADEFSPLTCTVICGMSMSGSSDTGSEK